jgi:hypothetical protein
MGNRKNLPEPEGVADPRKKNYRKKVALSRRVARPRVLGQKMVDEQRDIFLAFPQGRDVDGQDADPVKKNPPACARP